VDVQMMRETASFRYCEDEQVQVVELPYEGRAADMLVVLPREGVGLDSVRERLTGSLLSGWDGALAPRRVFVELPKFSLHSSRELTDLLKGMGMEHAFSEVTADFSGMVVDPDYAPWLRSAIQEAVIEVDEEGTVAAAVTSAPGIVTLSSPPPAIQFRANRPFMFLVRDRQTGSILFAGRVADPT
jgi:serpin B